jgi:hypothetical protein
MMNPLLEEPVCVCVCVCVSVVTDRFVETEIAGGTRTGTGMVTGTNFMSLHIVRIVGVAKLLKRDNAYRC